MAAGHQRVAGRENVIKPVTRLAAILAAFLAAPAAAEEPAGLRVNDQEYLEMPGLDVMVFHDTYPEGHQGGVTLVQNGVRVAANGDLRLEPTPGQWQPVPKVGRRTVDRERERVSVDLSFPDPEREQGGVNPIKYPELELGYTVHVTAEARGLRITVDLDRPLPKEWVGRAAFHLELFPGVLFGRTYLMDDRTGIFPRQLSGPMRRTPEGDYSIEPLASGRRLVVAPEAPQQRLTITAAHGALELLDGRAHHNNGWFIVRSTVPEGATEAAVDWVVEPNALPHWISPPVIHVSQVGYLPRQPKLAVIECDRRDPQEYRVAIQRLLPSGERETVLSGAALTWGRFARYRYATLDFTRVEEPGLYLVSVGDVSSDPFQIGAQVFDRHVWQPTLESFLPAQMCHMRVNDRYRVWHGLCHMDDARMAPLDTVHIDGYSQGSSTLTAQAPGQPVPGLNVGGWHDAGDFDLRVESQASTVYTLALAYEAFDLSYDETTVDQGRRVVELHRPNGKPDALEQIEHGVLAVLAGYRHMGRLYRGIIAPTVRQYVLLGDASTMTDNLVFDQALAPGSVTATHSSLPDDRWVFTEDNPLRELQAVPALAAASRVLRGYDDALAGECLTTAVALWARGGAATADDGPQWRAHALASAKVAALAELALTTDRQVYRDQLVTLLPVLERDAGRSAWVVGRLLPTMPQAAFVEPLTAAVQAYEVKLREDLASNPFGVPIRPHVWGVGWNVQSFGLHHYFLHKAWPEVVPARHVASALDYVLGCHPGANTASFASGVGARSLTVAYGTNRADWSYIPGGVASGTALIRPDLWELKEWPYLWQQTEYVMGGGASNFMFLALATRDLMR